MWSTILLIGSLHGLVVAVLLLNAARNRIANRFLAALLFATVLMITPYTIGYAGFYDAHPWLTFAPFYWQLLFGPLMYFHVRQLGSEHLPSGWAWHLLPGAGQGAYYLALFCLPLQAKWDWNERMHLPYALPAISIATLLSLAIYWHLSLQRYRRYQHWLVNNSGLREELRLGWIVGFLYAIAVVVALSIGFQVVDTWIRPLDYYGYFPFYVALTALVYYLGIEGWRHAGLKLPAMPEAGEATAADTPREDSRTSSEPRDWNGQAQAWAAKVAEAGWWREPDLSLADLARRLGTNTNYLSRALNDGLGQSFSEFVNRQRIAEAQRRLAGEGDVLDIALAVGFGSKASFNRAFLAYAGMTPSAWRQRHAGSKS
ncbi:helix-turn-helix domain-containing protein [Arenimonas sp.]|uniref:helix-turn-helix domain-containing protein n=1 Tax=Arenimonas sp. TaxID=1872635 RepID=UPI0039E23512